MTALFNKIIYNGNRSESTVNDLGLLILRLGMGGFMLFGHGLGKLMKYSEISGGFPDPLGIGSPLSMALVISAEFFAAIAIMLGLFTRLAAVPLIIAMSVAAFIQHAQDPFSTKEMALMYLGSFTVLLLTGPGRFSVDALLAKYVFNRKSVHEEKHSISVNAASARMETFV